MDVRDFEVGQTVWIELRNNKARGLPEDKLIEEWEVTKVGRKYLYAKEKSKFGYEYGFYSRGDNYMVEHSDYTPDYYLYKTKEEIETEFDKRNKEKAIREFMRLQHRRT